MHHYNFPGYSVGEAKPSRSPGRREIGHGALAERALLPVLPSEEEFPYAIRVVSEVVSSKSIWMAVIPFLVPPTLKSISPWKSSTPWMSMKVVKDPSSSWIKPDWQGWFCDPEDRGRHRRQNRH